MPDRAARQPTDGDSERFGIVGWVHTQRIVARPGQRPDRDRRGQPVVGPERQREGRRLLRRQARQRHRGHRIAVAKAVVAEGLLDPLAIQSGHVCHVQPAEIVIFEGVRPPGLHQPVRGPLHHQVLHIRPIGVVGHPDMV